MISSVMINTHMMFGVDFHNGISLPVPPAAPITMGPNIVTPTPLFMGPYGALTGKPSPSVLATPGGIVMQQGTDIGPLIIHIPLPFNILLPLVILGSASKCYFGASTVKSGGPKGANPVAVAVLKVVNINLNCGTFASTTGIVPAPNTVNALFTLGDLVSGLVTMFVEAVIQDVLNLIFDKGLGGALEGIFGKAAMEALGPQIAQNVLGAVLGLAAGSPLGASGSDFYKEFGFYPPGDPSKPDWHSPAGAVAGMLSGAAGDEGQQAGEAMNRMLNNPNVEQHPSSSGADSGAPAGALPAN
jgi:hypothetical protein